MNASNAANTSSPPNNNYNNNKWQDFGRANAWDDVPEIGQYVSDAFVHHGKNSSALANIDPTATEGDQESAMRIRGMRITDFPGDRLSLPVTPAPDPAAQLQKLASSQSDVLQRLASSREAAKQSTPVTSK